MRVLSFLLIPVLLFFGGNMTIMSTKDQINHVESKRVSKIDDLPAYLQDISVTIHAAGSQGSGVIKTRDNVNYVFTAAHVVSDLRHVRQVVDPKTGSRKSVVEFKDAKVVKELIEDGRSVGKIAMDAEVIRYSDYDNGEDLALLRIRKKNFVKSSAHFYLENKIPPVGTKLFHVGSLLGQMGSNSLTSGIVSQNGRVISGKVFDQTTCTAFNGSSGGGVYLEGDGRYVGMVTRGCGETFNLIVPIRRISSWAKKVGVEFAVSDSVPVPTKKELDKFPIEDSGPSVEEKCNRCEETENSSIRKLIYKIR